MDKNRLSEISFNGMILSDRELESLDYGEFHLVDIAKHSRAAERQASWEAFNERKRQIARTGRPPHAVDTTPVISFDGDTDAHLLRQWHPAAVQIAAVVLARVKMKARLG